MSIFLRQWIQLRSSISQQLELLGVNFYTNRRVKEFVGENNKLKSVLLSDGLTLQADLSIVAVGKYTLGVLFL
jgi:uncharacterized FAD-dependent dehydrogenase